MIIQKYEELLNSLNIEIQNGTFDIEKNKEYIEKIMEIYKESRKKNYSKVKSLLIDIESFSDFSFGKIELKKSSPGSSNLESFFKGVSGTSKDNVKFKKSFESKKDDKSDLEEIQTDKIYMDFGELRDWNTESFDEDNIENFNSIEMISALFLQNLKEKLGEK